MSKRSKPDQKQIFNILAKEFHELVNNKQALRTALEHFLNNVVDDTTLGIIFDLHRKHKTKAYDLETDEPGEEEENKDVDIFAAHNMKKTQDCLCPNCGDKVVAATRFAIHLNKCMGIETTNRINRTRRVTTNNKEKDGSSYSGITSEDDDDDVEWNSGDKRRKKKTKNGRKKSKSTPKKTSDFEPVEALNVDVEGDDEDLTNLRDILHLQDHSSSTSPTDSATSSHSSSSRKRERRKSKKSKRDRLSPSSNLSID